MVAKGVRVDSEAALAAAHELAVCGHVIEWVRCDCIPAPSAGDPIHGSVARVNDVVGSAGPDDIRAASRVDEVPA